MPVIPVVVVMAIDIDIDIAINIDVSIRDIGVAINIDVPIGDIGVAIDVSTAPGALPSTAAPSSLQLHRSGTSRTGMPDTATIAANSAPYLSVANQQYQETCCQETIKHYF